MHIVLTTRNENVQTTTTPMNIESECKWTLHRTVVVCTLFVVLSLPLPFSCLILIILKSLPDIDVYDHFNLHRMNSLKYDNIALHSGLWFFSPSSSFSTFLLANFSQPDALTRRLGFHVCARVFAQISFSLFLLALCECECVAIYKISYHFAMQCHKFYSFTI